MLTPTDGIEPVSLGTCPPRERNPTEESLAGNRNLRLEKCSQGWEPIEQNLACENPSVRLGERRYRDSQSQAQDVSKMVDIKAVLVHFYVGRSMINRGPMTDRRRSGRGGV